jgi:hypothetical protein
MVASVLVVTRGPRPPSKYYLFVLPYWNDKSFLAECERFVNEESLRGHVFKLNSC